MLLFLFLYIDQGQENYICHIHTQGRVFLNPLYVVHLDALEQIIMRNLWCGLRVGETSLKSYDHNGSFLGFKVLMVVKVWYCGDSIQRW